MRKACINEIKELSPFLQNIGNKYFVNTYSVQQLGQREFDGECKVLDFVGPKHALVSLTFKQGDLPDAKGLRIMKLDDGKLSIIEEIQPKSKLCMSNKGKYLLDYVKDKAYIYSLEEPYDLIMTIKSNTNRISYVFAFDDINIFAVAGSRDSNDIKFYDA